MWECVTVPTCVVLSYTILVHPVYMRASKLETAVHAGIAGSSSPVFELRQQALTGSSVGSAPP